MLRLTNSPAVRKDRAFESDIDWSKQKIVDETLCVSRITMSTGAVNLHLVNTGFLDREAERGGRLRVFANNVLIAEVNLECRY